MTRTEHIVNFFRGIMSILLALVLFFFPGDGLPFVLKLLSVSLSIRGLRSLVYYLSMARFAVGGKIMLYQGIFLLDLGVSIWALAETLSIYLVIYVAVMNVFSGLVAILRARESSKTGSPHWRLAAAYGITSILMAAAIVISCFGLGRPGLALYVYAVGMIYSGLLQIIGATRKTAIIYIQ